MRTTHKRGPARRFGLALVVATALAATVNLPLSARADDRRDAALESASQVIADAGTTLSRHLTGLQQALGSAPKPVLPDQWQNLAAASAELESKTTAAIALRERILNGSDVLAKDAMNLLGAFSAIEAEFNDLALEAEGEAGPTGATSETSASLPPSAFSMLAQEAAAHRRAAELTRQTAERFTVAHKELREKLLVLQWADRPLKRIHRASQNYRRLADLGGTLEAKQAELKAFAEQLNAVLAGLDTLNEQATQVVSLIGRDGSPGAVEQPDASPAEQPTAGLADRSSAYAAQFRPRTPPRSLGSAGRHR